MPNTYTHRPLAGPADTVDIPSSDIREQLAAAVAHFAIRYAEGTATPRTNEAVIDALQAVGGVASVGLHVDPATGSVDANVEVLSGDSITVHVGDNIVSALACALSSEIKTACDLMPSGSHAINLQAATVLAFAKALVALDAKMADLEAQLLADSDTLVILAEQSAILKTSAAKRDVAG